MKKIKSLFSVIIAFSVIFSALPSFSAETTGAMYTDNMVNTHELLLNRIGIDAVYDENAYITRGDFTVLAVQAMGVELIAGENSFTDVSESQSIFINTALNQGLVSENENNLFYPDRIITTQEAATICMRILGYGDIIKGENAYPDGYMTQASKLKILENVSLGQELTGAQAAKMIFNTLDSNYITAVISTTQGESTYALSRTTYLYDHFGVEKRKGTVTSVYGTSLNGYTAAKKDKIVIGGVAYENYYYSGFGYYTLLGQEVEYYTKRTNDVLELIYLKGRNEIEKVDFTEITMVKGFDAMDSLADKNAPKISYSKNGKSKSAKINPDATVLINGEKRLSVTNSDFHGPSGQITFIDSDGDSLFDVICVEYHRYYRISYFDSATGKLQTDDNKILLDVNDFKDENLIYLSGSREVGPEVLGEKVVIQVMATFIGDAVDPLKNTIISVKSQAITGEIEYIDEDDNIGISGNSYRVLPEILTELRNRIGSKTTFFLGNDNLIVRYDDFYDGVALEYGYIVDVGDNGVSSHKFEILMYTENDEMIAFKVSDNLKYTGVYGGNYVVNRSVKEKDFLGVITKLQLVRYKLDSDGKIELIESAYDHTGEEDYIGFDENRFSLDWTNPSTKIYQRYVGNLYKATNTTTYFYVSTTSTNKEDFAVGSYIEKGYTVDGVKVSVYNSDKYMFPTVVVIENYPAGQVRLQDNCGTLLMVTNRKNARNHDDLWTTAFDSFSGRNLNTYFSKYESLSPINASHYNHPTTLTDISQLKNGDIIRCSSDAQGQIKRFIVLNEYDETHTASSWHAYANDTPEMKYVSGINYVCGKITAYVPGSYLKVECDSDQRFFFGRSGLTYHEYNVKEDKMGPPQTALPMMTVGDYVWFLAGSGCEISTLIRYVND